MKPFQNATDWEAILDTWQRLDSLEQRNLIVNNFLEAVLKINGTVTRELMLLLADIFEIILLFLVPVELTSGGPNFILLS